MDSLKKTALKAKEITNSWKSDLRDRGISLHDFLDTFYLENADKDASEEELFNHRERFKKSSNRNIEVAALYKSYFVNNYLILENVTIEDRNSAWELMVELTTRVSSIELENGLGCDKSALTSLHSLFDIWRSIARKGGIKSLKFLNHSKMYFDNDLRPFTSKWHTLLYNHDVNKCDAFRAELEMLQIKTKKYCKNLDADFFVGHS